MSSQRFSPEFKTGQNLGAWVSDSIRVRFVSLGRD